MTKDDVIDIIKDTSYCILGTTQGKQPHVRPMSPFLTEDGKLIIALFSHIRTIKEITENPLVELCYVDRKMCFCRLTGKAEISKNDEYKQILWDNVPSLKQYFAGPQDPAFMAAIVDINHVEAMSPQDQAPNIIEF